MAFQRFFPISAALFTSLLLTFLVASCGSEDSPTTPSPSATVLASASIDATGGSLEHADISLLVPAGAFAETADITLVKLADNPAGTSDSSAFRVDGLPADFTADLTVRFPAAEPGAESLFLVGEQAFISSLNEVATSYLAVEPMAEDGYQTITLPAIPADPGSRKEKSVEGITSVIFVEDHDPHNLTSEDGHFHITWLGSAIDRNDVVALAGYLEEAYYHFLNLDFSYEARTNWPVEILIKPMPTEKFGYYSNSKRGDNHGYIDFNQFHLADHETMRLTAGHEFFHLVQAFYDQRWSYLQATISPNHYWLNEATAAWSEAAFSEEIDFISATFDGVELQPLLGIERGALEDSEAHGYGMSALIKYLVSLNGTEILPEIYSRLSPEYGFKATQAIEEVVPDLGNIWSDFLQAYLLGDVYPIPPQEVSSALRSGSFNIRSEQDSHWSVTAGYPDLSGKVYTVILQDQNLPDSASLDLTLTGSSSKLLVFSYNSSVIELVAEGTGQVHVPGLQGIKASGRNLLLLVTQSRSEPGYMTQEALTLTAHVNRPEISIEEFTDIYFRLNMEVDQLFGNGSTGQAGFLNTQFHGTELAINGLEFSSDMDLEQVIFEHYTLHYYGSATGTFNAAYDTVLTATIELRLDSIFPEENVAEYHLIVTMEDVPLESYWPGASVNWGGDGEGICDFITDFHYWSYEDDWIATDFYCDEANYPFLKLNVQH